MHVCIHVCTYVCVILSTSEPLQELLNAELGRQKNEEEVEIHQASSLAALSSEATYFPSFSFLEEGQR